MMEKKRDILPEQPKNEYEISQQNDVNTSIMKLNVSVVHNSEFSLWNELCFPAPHFDNNSPVIQK